MGLNDQDHTLKYTIDAGPGPLEQMSRYVGEATEFCAPNYPSLLADLKKAAEA